MAKYNVHAGHNKIVRGASKFLDEVEENRKVKKYLIKYLKANGDTVYDTTDDKGKTKNAILANIVAKCNQHIVDLDISLHLNSGRNDSKGDGKTGGTEVICYSTAAKVVAKEIADAIADEFGYTLRSDKTTPDGYAGVKIDTGLYVLRKTKSKAVLIECCFVDDKDDAEVWDAKRCAKAIAKALTGKDVKETTSSEESKESEDEKADTTNFHIKVSGVIKGDVLNIRQKPDADSKKTGSLAYNDPNIYTIIETRKNGADTWGKLKSGIGWINLKYTKRV